MPFVTSNIEPVEEFTPGSRTVKLKTALPETEDARTEMIPEVVELVNAVLALPFESVLVVTVEVELERVPPSAVVTLNVTATPETGEPLESVAITSSGTEAEELGFMICPLPREIVRIELAPAEIFFKLNTALPADEEASTVVCPSCEEAVKVTLARPFMPVTVFTLLAVVVPLFKVPAPEVKT